MSNKPVNFYHGAKGTFKIKLWMQNNSYVKDHSFKEIKQALNDGFLPYIVDTETGSYYQLSSSGDNVISFSDTSWRINITSEDNINWIENIADMVIASNNYEVAYRKTSGTTLAANSVTSVTLSPYPANTEVPSWYHSKEIKSYAVALSTSAMTAGISIVGINCDETNHTVSFNILNPSSSSVSLTPLAIGYEVIYKQFYLDVPYEDNEENMSS